jgi:DNA polymerase/3'-5' exonuclease PolX
MTNIMQLKEAQQIAQKYVELLRPYCKRIEIAGSIRRQRPEVKDIEIVCIPKRAPLNGGLFGYTPDELVTHPGFDEIINSLEKVKGEPGGRYTQRKLPEGITLDLFMCYSGNGRKIK